MSQTVLITGAGTGIGLETALYLASKQFTVYATYLLPEQKDAIDTAAKKRGLSLNTLHMDITDVKSIERGVVQIMSETGAIYGVVNNAGVSLRGFFEDSTYEEAERTLRVNVLGTMAVTRAVLPYMRRARAGRIIFITSVGGRIGSIGVSVYCATKFAQEGFAESLMQEVRPLGIKVVIIEPGILKTERWNINRRIMQGSLNQNSPYYEWFRREEEIADRFVRASHITPLDVATQVYIGLRHKNPKLRYILGRYARLVILLRRLLPGRLFERIYFGSHIRWVTRNQRDRL